ncbi:glycosyltransferase family 39 protein [Vallitalea pronyensis]|uniref:Glycosyltransferase family 39 protein n=1 Tax=Vallitalea pronyensis TaxID=1348613 RepID=A0A8J8MH91_9FIRM|nr:glycosyltransferase family 39 protein [Vallitalea pronyensis]QUI21570.1 glycosyltransferase family 39 protein [Vallitalea pronyensis]
MKKYHMLITIVFIIPMVYTIVYAIIPSTGAIYTHDSIAYTYGAKTWLEGKGMLYFGYKTPIIQWPPLYILWMTIPIRLGMEPALFVRLMNPLLHVLLVIVLAKWLCKHMHHKWMVYVGVVLVTFSIPMLHVMRFIWTEPVFIVLFVMACVCFHNYVVGHQLKWLMIAAILSALCWLTRYMGVTLLMTCTIYMLCLEQPIRKKVGHVFLYGTIASMPMVIWVMRNLFISHTFTGSRGIHKIPLLTNIRKSLHILYVWFAPGDSANGWVVLLIIVITIAVAFCVKRCWRNGHKSHSSMGAMLILFIGLYSAILLFIASHYAMDPLNDRMWVPIYMPVIWLLLIVVDQLFDHDAMLSVGRLGSWCVTLSMVVTIFINVYQMTHYIKHKDEFHEAKEGYRFYGEESAMIPYIQDMGLGKDDVIMTNNPALLTFNTSIDCRWTPKRRSIALYEYPAIMGSIHGKQVYIAWFGKPDHATFYTVDELKHYHTIKAVKTFHEGSIYKIDKTHLTMNRLEQNRLKGR